MLNVFLDMWAGMCPDGSGSPDRLAREETRQLEGTKTLGELADEVRELRRVKVKLGAEIEQLRSAYQAELRKSENLTRRLEVLEDECESLRGSGPCEAEAAAAALEHEGDAGSAGRERGATCEAAAQAGEAGADQLQSMQDLVRSLEGERSALRLQLKQKEEELARHRDEDKLWWQERRIQELEAQCKRLEGAVASRDVVANQVDKQREAQLRERERVLEERLTQAEVQMRTSLEMQAALEEERKNLEEEKRTLESEVQRQEEAAAELQGVLASFFPDEMYTSMFELPLSGGHAAGPIPEQEPLPPPPPSEAAGPSTDEMMQSLHVRLNDIANKWKRDDPRAFPKTPTSGASRTSFERA
uniref:Uncharacterized protein n=1 Tax=Tetraselmis sp. GSL018 TaxID=582737 RepID=A0A061RDL4_9CHLO|mmetsp:Transcript_9547/g.22968  ORF Transcript_9547/g.22968 Transcript_9547/m.22968 type:complete len:359 (+) Transcript_9547:139-1215(+)|eukprot:CAMPEP_0177591492 /NCGR_PEP_ID=MMETSP0419_2-20121207/8025_1 /TAXON_ID=582737 /ORGANISM="Tetraselmis sp., Strain GSL018" /LENGTH=358 /DNA_ID=CAMNT_0019082235 /DNA_START=70 /DNA_END=1146 /DNA_ORIENTATION=+